MHILKIEEQKQSHFLIWQNRIDFNMKSQLSNPINQIQLPIPKPSTKTLLNHCHCHFLSYSRKTNAFSFRAKLRSTSNSLSVLLYNHSKLRISACNASSSDSLVVSTGAEEDAESAQIFEVFFFFFLNLFFGFVE